MAKTDASRHGMVNMHDAKTQLSRLIARVEAGEQVTIARNGTPVARLVPYRTRKRSDIFGCMSHLPPLPDDFLDPDPEIEHLFGMR